MPAEGPPSEFGGKVQDNGVQPSEPVATSPAGNATEEKPERSASERLSLVYRTGDSSGDSPLEKSAFEGG